MKRPSPIALASVLSIDNNEHGNELIEKPTKRCRFSIDFNWTVSVLPEMPYFYLKEKTSVVIFKDSPQEIANRIIESAKEMNCIGECNGSTAKAILTVDDTEFSIQLFRVWLDEKRNECTFVELQRLSGSPIVFHTVARNILAASKKNVVSSNTKTAKVPRVRRNLTISRIETTGLGDNEEESKLLTCSVGIVDCLLKKDRIDANLLGMESLQLLTNKTNSSDSMVSYASNIVMDGGEFMDVRDRVISLMANDEPEESVFELKYYNKMRLCAFQTLANALDNIFNNTSSIEKHEKFANDDSLMSILLGELENDTGSNAHVAYFAAKALLSMIENSSRTKSIASVLGISSADLKNKDGKNRYSSLRNVTDGILQVVGEAK